MKRWFVLPSCILIFFYSSVVFGSDSDLFTTQVPPNILIILDNSNSMDENFWGKAIGSYSSTSKSVIGRNVLKDIVEQYKYRMRLGLMTYKLFAPEKYFLHDARYFISYEPKSYCPNPPPECVQYARTGDPGARSVCTSACQVDNPLFNADYMDEIINHFPVGSGERNRYSNLLYPKSHRVANPSDPSNYVYFKSFASLYDSGNLGGAFCYSSEYNPEESTAPDGDFYDCYGTKRGTEDNSNGYDNYYFPAVCAPTDTDVALGYKDFGRRLTWDHVGQAWFSGASPGGGFLNVAVNNLIDNNGQGTTTYTNILGKLDTKENDEAGYMGCAVADKNTCPYIINAGLTPTSGTLQSASDYFQGKSGYTSPITARCQKNFIVYVTDGLPSVDKNGIQQDADALMPDVLAKIDALRSTQKTIGSTSYTFDIRTYVLGLGLSEEAKSKLDEMAVHGGSNDALGHAYYADSQEQLIETLGSVFGDISRRAYSFNSPSVPSVRMIDNNRLYVSSFIPQETPFWQGFLKAYNLNSDGTLDVNPNGNPYEAPIWDASFPSAASRTIKTYSYLSGGFKDFTISNVTPADLGVSKTTDRDAIVNYVRSQKLGDIYHSNSVVVGSPSSTFGDEGFKTFYDGKKSRPKIVVVGANDGMLHAFDESTGVEKWAFIPNTLLKSSTTTGSAGLNAMRTSHNFYVDSSPKVADVWSYRDAQWKTVLVCGLRKGGKSYFALDITDTSNPKYLWEYPLLTDTTTLAKLGQSWSEPAIGKIKIVVDGLPRDRWVAFIGGGFDSLNKTGKIFYVLDLEDEDGDKKPIPIWQFSTGMNYSFPASPTAVDINSDGYIDKVYIGDLGGQLWVFDVSSNLVANWTGKVLFQAPTFGASLKHKIYNQPVVAFDRYGVPWIYFGTGDRENPNDYSSSEEERFYAVIDDGTGTYPKGETDLKNVTSDNTFARDLTKKGWYVTLEKVAGKYVEKVLAKASVFNRMVYFTTYSNTSNSVHDDCDIQGISKLYVVEYVSGGGALDVDSLSDLSGDPSNRSKEIGGGAPLAPVISVNSKASGSVIVGTTWGQIYSQHAFSPSSDRTILYWREVTP